MRRVASTFAVRVLLPTLLCVWSVVATAPRSAAQADDVRPVVVTGSDLPGLLGADVAAPVCVALVAARWVPCPLQIDERARLDRGSNYPPAFFTEEFYGIDSTLFYTAPQDHAVAGFAPYTPPDPDPTFDADDELVVMARDFGARMDSASPPIPDAPFEVYELSAEGHYAYVFVPTVPRDQSAGAARVSYTFDLLAGDFPEAYDFSGDHFAFYRDSLNKFVDSLAANPEYSVVETPYYRTSFEDRWIHRELQAADGFGYGPDLLDRVKMAPSPSYSQNDCGRSVWTGSAQRGTLGIQKSGPVRALRVVQGYNSGGYNETTYYLYERLIETRSVVAMHRTRLSQWYDLSEDAVGSTLYSNVHPDGVLIDGEPDYADGDVFSLTPLAWDYLIGPAGSMIGVWEADGTVADLAPGSYYEDDVTPTLTNCGGDGQAVGNYGNTYANVNGFIPSTDPREGDAYLDDGSLRTFAGIRRLVPAAPNLSRVDAEAVVAQLEAPIDARPVLVPTPTTEVSAPTISGRFDADTTRFDGTVTDDGSGVRSILPSRTSVNLRVEATFQPGDQVVSFGVTAQDLRLDASGYVVAMDRATNADSVFVFIPAQSDTSPPVVTGAYQDGRFVGTARDSRPTDRGLAVLALSASANNLRLAAAFAPGDSVVAFTIVPMDDTVPSSGYVLAEDLAMLRDSVFVSFDGRAPDTTAPNLNGGLVGQRFEGTATDSTVQDLGLATLSLGGDAVNLRLDASFVVGADTASFTATALDDRAPAAGFVVATDVAGNADSLWIAIDPFPDDTPPVFDGEAQEQAWTGSATDSTSSDSGLAEVMLDPEATNLSITVAPFATGASATDLNIASVDRGRPADGFVVATDAAGNVDSLRIAFAAAPRRDLTLTLRYTFADAASGSITVAALNRGTETMSNVRVKRTQQRDVNVGQKQFDLGPIAPGATAEAVFTFSQAGAGAYTKFRVQDRSTRVRDEDDPTNNTAEAVLDPAAAAPDTSAPTLSGAVSDGRFLGTATEESGGSGLALLELCETADNLALSVVPFNPGAASAAFTVDLVSLDAPGTGYVRGIDQAGNVDSVQVRLDALLADTVAPALSGTYQATTFGGRATDARFGDSGIASLELGEAAANMRLDVTSFDVGADAVDFSVLLANPTQMGRGYVVARDVAGNADSVLVKLDAPSAPIQDLTIDVAYTFDTATSGTITATVRNLGTVAMNNVRVKRTQRLNVSIAPNQVDLGPVEPGGSTDAVFSFSAVRENAFAKFRVQDRSTRVRDEDDPANNTAEAFLVAPRPARSTAPDLAADQTASPLDDEREVDARDDAAPTDEASRDEHANASAATREAGLQQSGPSSPDQARERAGASDAPSVDLALSVHYAFEDEASGRLVATVENIGSRQAHRVRVKRAFSEGVKLEAKAAAAASLVPGATSTFEFAFSERRPGARIALSAEEGGLRGIEPVRWNNTVDVALRRDAAGVEFGPRVPENVAPGERLSSTSAEPEPAAASVSVPPPAPEEGLALSAYPNPASDVTTLRFYLDEPGPVQVVLYDLTGRTILRVHEGALDAGWHRIPLDASPLAGGTYVWQVATSRRSSSGNVTVVR